MSAQFIRAGAFSGAPATWHQIGWSYCHRQDNKLQARIVKATRLEGRETDSRQRVLRGASRMRGNLHVQF